ncbi:MAG TPA: tetratricopeptide repeat protein, partial [Myxococcota bacterium]|nr:tetratricopeptide repeat protein [Myxococcota bacterium]
MTEYLTEQEQIELLKNWIKQYSRVILLGVFLAILCISGWRFWQQRTLKMTTRASNIYDEMLTARAQNDITATVASAKKLTNRYAKTIYGEMSYLMSARDAINQKDYQQAINPLTDAIDHGKMPGIRQIARLRLARVYLMLNLPEKSLNTLEKIDDKTFLGLIEEVRGDTYLLMKKHELARQSYQAALQALP